MSGIHIHWGMRDYADMHTWQQELVQQRAQDEIPNVLLTGEHPPVITLGRKTPSTDAYDGDIPVVAIERGGEATFHGPGQLVAYPIVHLTESRKDLHAFQRDLEEIGIRTLAEFGIEGERSERGTGVWVGRKKIQSLGIAVRKWITWHGLALNVSTDLAVFRQFRPCGLDGGVMTSMVECLNRPVNISEVVPHLVRHASAILPEGPFVAGSLPERREASD